MENYPTLEIWDSKMFNYGRRRRRKKQIWKFKLSKGILGNVGNHRNWVRAPATWCFEEFTCGTTWGGVWFNVNMLTAVTLLLTIRVQRNLCSVAFLRQENTSPNHVQQPSLLVLFHHWTRLSSSFLQYFKYSTHYVRLRKNGGGRGNMREIVGKRWIFQGCPHASLETSFPQDFSK